MYYPSCLALIGADILQLYSRQAYCSRSTLGGSYRWARDLILYGVRCAIVAYSSYFLPFMRTL